MFGKLFGSEGSTLIDTAFGEVSTMLLHSATMYDHARAALLDNQPLEHDLEALDDVVDAGEREVRRAVVEHLSLRPGQDLVPSLILVSIVQDAERLGDFSRGLAELLPLAKSERVGPIRDRLAEIGDEIRTLFDDCERAFREGEAADAAAVVERANELKAQVIRVTEDVAASDLSADMAVVYSGAARILRRVAAHLSNICSTVSQPFDRIRQNDEDA